MKHATIFQCIPAYKPSVIARLIRSLDPFSCKIVLDLEDGIQDVVNPKNSTILKADARKAFEEILSLFPDRKFCIRINAISSDEFQKDIPLLEKYGDRIEILCLPKVENELAITTVQSCTSRKFRINLIIETQIGIRQLPQIVNKDNHHDIEYVMFGNYDYHLDLGIFPIVEQCSDEYWQMIAPLIKVTEDLNLKFCNSPYVNLADQATLHYSYQQLNCMCSDDFALLSLHKQQTCYLFNLINNIPTPTLENARKENAEFELDYFRKHRQKGRSFSLLGNRILTPQEYLLINRKK